MSSSTSSECGHVMRNSTPSGVQCTPVVMLASDGKKRKTQAADLEGIFRIIQSIPSKKAEPVRQWLAELAAVLLSHQNGLLTTSNPLKGMMAKHSHPLTKTNNSDRDLCLTNKTSTLIPTRRDWTWSSSNSEATTSTNGHNT